MSSGTLEQQLLRSEARRPQSERGWLGVFFFYSSCFSVVSPSVAKQSDEERERKKRQQVETGRMECEQRDGCYTFPLDLLSVIVVVVNAHSSDRKI